MSTPTISQLKHAIALSEQIEKLQAELASLFGGSVTVPAPKTDAPVTKATRRGRRKISAAHRAKLAASAKARWAKLKGTEAAPQAPAPAAPAPKTKKKGGMSAAGRARIVAAQKARWAKVKAGKSMPGKAAPVAKKKKRQLSPEARARIVAAVKARWARVKKAKS